jgi:outer membrane protein assembly factor BamD
MKNKVTLYFFLFLFTLFSCSDYRKIVKGDDYQLKFELSNKLYDKAEFDRCIILFEQVYQHSPKSPEGELSYFRLANSYFKNEDYNMAGYYFNNFVDRFPYSKKSEDAMFLVALCSVNNSPKYGLDQSETMIAINNVQQFVDVFPQSILVDSCNKIIDRLKFKLELKDFDAVKLYSKTENYKAAVTSCEIFMDKYINSRFSEEVNFLYVKNSIFLAKNSIESKKEERIEKSKERFLNFVKNYDKSIYFKELNSLINSFSVKQN